LQDAIANGRGFDGTDEYDPVSDDHTNLPAKVPQVQILAPEGSETSPPKAEVQIERWTAEERELTVTSPRPMRLAIRLLDYPAWRLEVNGHPLTPEFPEGTAQIILPLPAGREQIQMGFRRTEDRTVGNTLSLIGLVVCGAVFWKRRSGEALP